ncbi:MAG: hypothetical protein D6793_00035, partial [Thermoflexia bacterium]
MLLVASGKSVSQAACDRRVRAQRNTVSEWVRRFRAEGPEGLRIKPGRGRKPSYAPLTREEARLRVEQVLHRSPADFGIARTRRWLRDVQKVLAWLEGKSEAGVYKASKRLGFSRKQALQVIHSPDPEHRAKWRAILRAFQEAREHPAEVRHPIP